MMESKTSKFISKYGMLVVLLLLVVLFSTLTIREQFPSGQKAADKVWTEVAAMNTSQPLIIIARDVAEDREFAEALSDTYQEQFGRSAQLIVGGPPLVRSALDSLNAAGVFDYSVATSAQYSPTVRNIVASIPELSDTQIITPPSYSFPTFLLADNLRNIANQISVIAIVAIGMTMIIITAGIDLSVGSLIALAAVFGAWLIGQLGGTDASVGAMILGSLGAILMSALVGGFSGAMITTFRIPPFIATLAMMQVASGLAYIMSQGRPIYQIPDSFVGLGRGVDPVLGLPWAVLLMIALYVIAHFVMSRTVYGRAIYAVGGNEEAARLAGIRVKRVLLSVYIISGALAGLGGIVMASQLKSGAPTYGLMYELYVIAAVVVGGTSLAGGSGRIFGTLIGAFIIAVIQNGMNLTNVESYTQKVVLGLVILAAVLLDRLKHQGWRLKRLRLSK
jgi:ribose/xylose/arabinose/galactoside ABC-type transport system permease subunit